MTNDRPGEVTAQTFELQIAVAEIKGMLTATLARHDQRLDQHEGTLSEIDERVRDNGQLLARHDERIKDLEEDHDERIKDLEEDNDGRLGRITGTIGALVGVAALLWAIFSPAIQIGA
jgi:DNA anti-recombination protein RmuC